MAKKVTNDVMVAAAKATTDKEVADTAMTKKVANDVTLMKGVMKETIGGSADPDTTPTPAVGINRPFAPSGSSLPTKRSFQGPRGFGMSSIP
jgi:hypothetical protein